MSDFEMIALSLCAEALSIDFENPFWKNSSLPLGSTSFLMGKGLVYHDTTG
ncbi:MAG: hypothetical protein QM530_09635 [Phycisphaerales bacterium]|nr:hypothetical protein [Phycisphaerales bacterium]